MGFPECPARVQDEPGSTGSQRSRARGHRVATVRRALLVLGVGLAAGAAAETVDLRGRQSPVRDQAARGTCTAFGLVALLEALPGVPADLSEQWVYAQAKLKGYVAQPGARYRTGSTLGSFLDTLRLDGAVAEAEMPYNPRLAIWNFARTDRARFERDLGGAALARLLDFPGWTWRVPADALEYRAGRAARDTAWIQEQLDRGVSGVAAGYATVMPYWRDGSGRRRLGPDDVAEIEAGTNRMSWTAARRRYGERTFTLLGDGWLKMVPKAGQALDGGHVVTLVGHDRQGFRFKNSWGPDWGQDGYGQMTFNFHRLFAGELCVIRRAEMRALRLRSRLEPGTPVEEHLKILPVRTEAGAPALSLSLVWPGPDDPVDWRQVRYRVFDPIDGWERTAPGEAGRAAGYPAMVPLGARAQRALGVEVEGVLANGTRRMWTYESVRRRFGEHPPGIPSRERGRAPQPPGP